jgi:hypothetical protein
MVHIQGYVPGEDGVDDPVALTRGHLPILDIFHSGFPLDAPNQFLVMVRKFGWVAPIRRGQIHSNDGPPLIFPPVQECHQALIRRSSLPI